MRKNARFHVVSMVFLFVLATPRMAHAYVDPGSGAMIWQLAVAGILGMFFYVRRITGWVRGKFGATPKQKDPVAETNPTHVGSPTDDVPR
jgi:hypothetical protein